MIPKTNRSAFIATARGLRPTRRCLFVCTKDTTAMIAKTLKATPRPIQCICHAIPHSSLALFQSGVGSAAGKMFVGDVVGWVVGRVEVKYFSVWIPSIQVSFKPFSASLPLATDLSCNVLQQLGDRFDPSLKTFWRDTLVRLTLHHRYFPLDFQCSHNCVWVMFAWYYTFLL